MKPGKSGLARIIDATGHSMNGLKACWANEAAFRQNSSLAAVLCGLSFFVANSAEQWLLLNFPAVLLLIVELLNSAIENVVDRIGPERNLLSGRAKDMASAAVFVCLVLIGLSWTTVTWNNFFL
ncbi:MAG TPA: diacylglycerol kinase [Xanthomonadales bacterium]|nr:diacylglycerol kinase [Xanthomonadales bacterium]